MKIRSFLLTVAAVSLAALSSARAQNNEPPPAGAILDLAGKSVPHTAQGAQTYFVDFAAIIPNTQITFAFREDPAFISFSNASVVDLTTGSPTNLLVNGDFASGSGNNATGWTYANVFGAIASGVVSTNCQGAFATCWRDGAVQAYDAITQVIPTTVGDVYRIQFSLIDNGNLNVFQDLSTNGQPSTGGNAIDVLTYAQAGLPTPGVPEPSTWAMMLIGFAGLGFAFRQSRRKLSMA